MVRKVLKLALLVVIMLPSMLLAQSRNMLPRFPELIIEKGLSESFEVSECSAKASLTGNEADTNLRVTLKNISDKPVSSSVKFRILYAKSEGQTRIRVAGKAIKFDRHNPRHSFELQPQATISFEINAKTSINYSIDSVRKALREQENDNQRPKKGFLLDDLTKLFEREKYGRRFMVGPLVSKWGVFPLNFVQTKIEISIPPEFVLVSPNSEIWQESKQSRSKSFSSQALENFAAAVFLPEGDREEFIQTQQIMTSEDFMH